MTIKYSKGAMLVCVEPGANHLSYGAEYTVSEDFDSNIHTDIQIVANDQGKSNGYYAYRFQLAKKSTAPVLPPVKKNISYSLDHDAGMINIRISGELTNEQVLAILEVVQ